jgi:hypothetical protein
MHLFVAPGALARLLITALVACALVAGCARPDLVTDRIDATWVLEPGSPRTAGDTVARVTLRERNREPVRGARLRLEAQMSHPGMAPVVADFAERRGGVYEARVRLSMAGDWILVATGELADGTRFSRAHDVRGVAAAP